ncbi:MAG: hypothetical protein ACK4XY_10955 [Chloroherpetonaceae bacterium]
MKQIHFLALLVFTMLYGCGSSRPTAPTKPAEPQWFKTAMEQSQSFYDYHNLPAPDSLRTRTLMISLKGGVQEPLEVGDVLALAFQSKKLSMKDSEVLANALSASLQGIEAGKRTPESAEYVARLNTTYATLATSLARRADSLALATHRQINALDEAYRKTLQSVMTADTRTSVFFAGNYEKIKRLLPIELELAQFALEEYRRCSERLRLVGQSDESVAKSRQKFLTDIRTLMTNRALNWENAYAQLNAKANEDASRTWYVEAANHYGTLLRLSKENLAQLQKIDSP